MNKKDDYMLILSGLFPNKKGNQSMMNSIKGYSKKYRILLITTASIESDVYYYSVEEIGQLLPTIKIWNIWPKVFQKKFLKLFFNIKNKRTTRHNDDINFVNVIVGPVDVLVFYLRAIFLFLASIMAIIKYRPKVICAYEIFALPSTAWIKRIFRKIKIFGKFQGTVLGAIIDTIDEKGHKNTYAQDFIGMKYIKSIDCSIMTNDGTRGDEVLKYFGMSPDSILFIQNGLDDQFIIKCKKYVELRRLDNETVYSISVSRLTPWKRVDIIVRSISRLVHAHSFKKIKHRIIGVGAESEINVIKNLILEYKVQDYVEYIGSSTINGIVDHLKKSDLLISLYKNTNIANPVFEAVSLCVPVLTIYQPELKQMLGDKASACCFIEESSDIEESVALAILENQKKGFLEKQDMLLKSKDHIFSWSERSRMEIEFFENINI